MKLVPKSDGRTREPTRSIGRFLPGKPRAKPADEVSDTAYDIGARFELVTEKLENAQKVAEHIQVLVDLVEQIRAPILEEFGERRAEHAELQAVRAAQEETAEQMAEALSAVRDLTSRLNNAEAAQSEADGRREAVEALLRARDSELQELRVERDALRSQTAELTAAHKESVLRLDHTLEECATLRGQAELGEHRRRESEATLAKLQQERQILDQELEMANKRLEQANVDGVRQAGLVAQLEEQLRLERDRNAALDASLVDLRADMAKEARAFEAKLDVGRSELNALEAKLEAANARAAKLDELNTSLTRRIADANVNRQVSEQEVAALKASLERAMSEALARKQEVEAVRRDAQSIEQARAAAVERAEELASLAHSRELAVKRAEHRTATLKERLDAAQAEFAAKRAAIDDRLAKLKTQLDLERSERAITEGALESARRDRARLQQQVLTGHEAETAQERETV